MQMYPQLSENLSSTISFNEDMTKVFNDMKNQAESKSIRKP